MGEMISIKRPDGGDCPAYATGDEGKPGFVMIQEWWGLNDQMKGLADRLAAQGYRVVVPDLFRGKLTQEADEANHLMSGLNFVDAGEQDVRGCVQHLKQKSAKVAVGGFCMGGALTLIAAVKVPEMDAGVCFYGIPPAEVADPKTIKKPLLCHFANQDDWCTPDAVNGLEAALKESGATFTLHRYDAQHAFMNEKRPEVYDEACAKLAWDRTLEFLGAQLS